MSWINVKDQLPPDPNDVLAFAPEEGCFRAWIENQIWLTHETNNKTKPTHWMPLPEEPRVRTAPLQNGYGMTDNLISSETRPYSVWSETADTAKDIRKAWETRFGGPYQIVKSEKGYEVKYMGKWNNDPASYQAP